MSAEAAPKEPSKSSIVPKLLVGSFVVAVIVLETLIFFFMVPSAEDVAALAESRLVERLEARLISNEEEVVDDSQAIVEVKLGPPFGLSFNPSGSDTSYRVEFDLRGTVKKENLSKVEKLLVEREGRFRHRLMLDMRNATLDELKENQLGLIQRRILATSNDVFEEPILLGIVFHSYQLLED